MHRDELESAKIFQRRRRQSALGTPELDARILQTLNIFDEFEFTPYPPPTAQLTFSSPLGAGKTMEWTKQSVRSMTSERSREISSRAVFQAHHARYYAHSGINQQSREER